MIIKKGDWIGYKGLLYNVAIKSKESEDVIMEAEDGSQIYLREIFNEGDIFTTSLLQYTVLGLHPSGNLVVSKYLIDLDDKMRNIGNTTTEQIIYED